MLRLHRPITFAIATLAICTAQAWAQERPQGPAPAQAAEPPVSGAYFVYNDRNGKPLGADSCLFNVFIASGDTHQAFVLDRAALSRTGRPSFTKMADMKCRWLDMDSIDHAIKHVLAIIDKEPAPDAPMRQLKRVLTEERPAQGLGVRMCTGAAVQCANDICAPNTYTSATFVMRMQDGDLRIMPLTEAAFRLIEEIKADADKAMTIADVRALVAKIEAFDKSQWINARVPESKAGQCAIAPDALRKFTGAILEPIPMAEFRDRYLFAMGWSGPAVAEARKIIDTVRPLLK